MPLPCALAREASGGSVPVAGSFSVMRPAFPAATAARCCDEWPEAEARRLFAAKAEGFVRAGADLIAMEMMRDGDYSVWATEAAVATGCRCGSGSRSSRTTTDALIGFGRPNWLLEDFVDALLRSAPAMVSVMHTSPHDTGPASGGRAPALARSLGAYAESGYFAMPDWQFADIIPEGEYVDLARQWARGGRPGDDRRMLRHRPLAHRCPSRRFPAVPWALSSRRRRRR